MPTGTDTTHSSLYSLVYALYVVGLLALGGGSISTMTIEGWLSGAFCVIVAIAVFLYGLLGIGSLKPPTTSRERYERS